VPALTDGICRGDVGSWVREAAMESVAQILLALGQDALTCGHEMLLWYSTALFRVLRACLRQAAERITRVRELSAQ
jgi:hypothetical protein